LGLQGVEGEVLTVSLAVAAVEREEEVGGKEVEGEGYEGRCEEALVVMLST
jgi:hypothetical protein